MLPAVVFSEVNFVLNFEAELREGKERKEGGHDHGHIKMRVVAEVEGSEVECEEALEEHP